LVLTAPQRHEFVQSASVVQSKRVGSRHVLPVVLARGTVAAADGGGAAGSGALSRQLEAIAEVNAIATVSRFIASLADTR
jgi:hypothetical protein